MTKLRGDPTEETQNIVDEQENDGDKLREVRDENTNSEHGAGNAPNRIGGNQLQSDIRTQRNGSKAPIAPGHRALRSLGRVPHKEPKRLIDIQIDQQKNSNHQEARQITEHRKHTELRSAVRANTGNSRLSITSFQTLWLQFGNDFWGGLSSPSFSFYQHTYLTYTPFIVGTGHGERTGCRAEK